MQRHILYFILCILCFTGVFGIPANSVAVGKRITFTDALQKTVTVNIPVQRIVVLNSDAAEILSAIGASDRIVGIGGYIAGNSTHQLYSLKDKATAGYPNNPSMEKIIELAPDLVITYAMWLTPAAFEDRLVPLGIPVARIDCYQLDKLESDIRLLGRLTGLEKEAEAYVAAFRKPLDIVQARLTNLKHSIRVYTEGYTDYSTSSKSVGASLMLEQAGVVNIADDLPADYPRVTAEWVVVQNPDVILKAAGTNFVKSGYGITDTNAFGEFRDRMLNRPGWHQINAVKTGKVYLLSAEIWVGPRAPIGILYISKWCYPDLFRDIDPQAFHREWLQTWHHKELNGVYVYPEHPNVYISGEKR